MIFRGKKGQVTLFIILAIVVVAAIVIFFTVRSPLEVSLPQDVRQVYDYYLNCLEENTRQGIALLGEQAGHIEVPEFEPGSAYRPFSSQLDFFGQPIPYWVYVSGNNILKEQVPTKNEMNAELENYVADRLDYCDFSSFEAQGFEVFVDTGKVDVKINELGVDVSADNPFLVFYEDNSYVVKKHDIKVDSKLGRFYDLAVDVYEKENSELFLEEYSLDVLRLYAPTTGVDFSCSPRVFSDSEIREELTNALADNLGYVKLKGDYYRLSDSDNKYYVVDVGTEVSDNVNFIYSPNFPTRIEIFGDKVAEPVGMQKGLGVLGFCYVPYHLVYDINFPVLVQFYDEEFGEIFQFPISVLIEKNQARSAMGIDAGESIESPVCEFKNQDVRISTYDSYVSPVEAQISFKCLDQDCYIGETTLDGGRADLRTGVPQCVNGFLVASAEGYSQSKVQIDSNEEGSANIVMNKLYEFDLNFEFIGSSEEVGSVLVNFESDEYSTSVYYPDMETVKLVEGNYKVRSYAYKEGSLTIPKLEKQECVDVPKSGLGGIVGLEEEKCFDIEIPEQQVEIVIIGGGVTEHYFIEDELENSEELNIEIPLIGVPESVDELQGIYEEIEYENLFVSLD